MHLFSYVITFVATGTITAALGGNKATVHTPPTKAIGSTI